MFGDLLAQVKPQFSKAELLTALFPSLVAWSLVVLLVAVGLVGWNGALAFWTASGADARSIVMAAFLVWVVIWSYLAVSAQRVMLRLWCGEVDRRPLSLLFARLRKRKCTEWDALDLKDRVLEEQQAGLRDLVREFAAIQAIAADPSGLAVPAGDLRDRLRERVAAVLAQPEVSMDQMREIPELWRGVAPLRAAGDGGWAELADRLAERTRDAEQRLTRAYHALSAERDRLTQRFFLYFPAAPGDVMPTTLGNVLRAAEVYPWERYRLDAVVAWPRLAPSLPEEFARDIRNTRASLDLMLTLGAYCLLFGLPLAAWAAWTMSPRPGVWPVVVVLAAAFGLRAWVPLALGALALVLERAGAWQNILSGIGFFAFAAAVLLLACRAAYAGAVEGALTHGEKLKAAFDLYRFQLLEKLRIPRPRDLAGERALWQAIGQLFYRGLEPDPALYRYEHSQAPAPDAGPGMAAGDPGPSVGVIAAARSLPAFEPVGEDSLQTIHVPLSSVTACTARSLREVVGQCPLVQVACGTLLDRLQLVPPAALSGAVLVGVPSTHAMAFGGALRPGERVGLSLVESAGGESPQLCDVLVVDVKANAGIDDHRPFTVVLALPGLHAGRFLLPCAQGKVALYRVLAG